MPGAGKQEAPKTAYGAALDCFCRPLAEQETPKTAYGAAVDCFCGAGADRAGNAKNCLLGCVRLFLRAGGWLEQEPKTAYGTAVQQRSTCYLLGVGSAVSGG